MFKSVFGPKLLWPIAVAAITLITFSRILSHDFIHLDDGLHIYANPMLSPVSPSHLAKLWKNPYENLYIPISYTVFAILSLIAHSSAPANTLTDTGALLDPRVFHAASLFIHIINSLLVFSLLAKLFNQRIASAAGALVWSLHPIQVESVAWASELRGLLSAFFSLLALLTYPYGSALSTGARSKFSYIKMISLGICAMLCKPSAITTPLAALVIDLVVLKSSPRQAIGLCAIWLACILPLAFITGSAQNAQLPGPLYEPPFFLRPVIALDAIGFYIIKLIPFAPLCTDYGQTPIHVLHSQSTIWYCVIGALFLLSFFLTAKRLPIVFASELLFLAAILPVLGFVPFIFQYFSTVSDRYLYLAMLGPAVAACWYIAQPSLMSVKVGVAFFCVILAISSWIQTGYWKNTDIFAQHVLVVNPKSFAAAKLLGDDATARRNYAAAAAFSQKEIGSNPEDFRGYSDLGLSELEMGDAQKAVPPLLKALTIRPGLAINHENVGAAYLALGQIYKAGAEFQTAAKLSPDSALPQYQLAELSLAEHDTASAIGHLQKAIQLEPQYSKSFELLGSIYSRQGRTNDALNVYRDEIRYDPASAVPYFNAGVMFNRLGQVNDAANYFEEAIRIAPNYSEAHVSYGVILGQRGDLQGAIAQFQAAVAYDPTNQNAQQNLQIALSMQAEPQK